MGHGVVWRRRRLVFSCGGFAGHVKLTFGHGTALTPVPPVAPIGMGKESRGVDLDPWTISTSASPRRG